MSIAIFCTEELSALSPHRSCSAEPQALTLTQHQNALHRLAKQPGMAAHSFSSRGPTIAMLPVWQYSAHILGCTAAEPTRSQQQRHGHPAEHMEQPGAGQHLLCSTIIHTVHPSCCPVPGFLALLYQLGAKCATATRLRLSVTLLTVCNWLWLL